MEWKAHVERISCKARRNAHAAARAMAGVVTGALARARALAAAGVVALAIVPGLAFALTPSPTDWRDLVIYQILTDRFADGNPANNALEGSYVPSDGARIHGGDFAGIEGKLDYIENLGVNAIWLSPVLLNANAEYHGYAARDLFSVAPHFGTLAELQSLVAACHARGIYIVMDVVVNHMGDLIHSTSGSYPAYRYPTTYTLSWRDASKRYFGVLDNLSKFHAHGNIGSFVDPEQVVGELFSLDDLKTEDAAVQNELKLASEWLIENTDCDGYRIDTVKHVEMSFWNTWAPAVHAHATARGKGRFFLFGEVFDGDDSKNGSYTGTVSGGNYKLDAVLHYPMYNTTNGVFGFDNPPSEISNRYAQLGQYDPTSREQLVTFLDNHDNSRFLGFGIANQDESRLRAALGWQLTSRGVPCVYYGTEQEFDGGGDPYNREDMWDGAWDFGPSDFDNFDLVHPLFLHTRRLLDARRRHEALRRGVTTERGSEAAGPGYYVYDRRTATDTVLVAINTSNAPVIRVGQTSPWVSGSVLVDVLDPAVRDTIGAGGAFTLRLPARGVRVLESLAASAATASAEVLHITSTYPGHDQNLNDRSSPMTVKFDRPIDSAVLPGAFSITPATGGAWQVAGDARSAKFFPAAMWGAGTSYAWSFDMTLVSADGRLMPAAFASTFKFLAPSTGITVAGGFTADRIARQGLGAAEGIVSVPALGALLVTDTSRDRIFTVTPGGDLGHWLGDSRWTESEGVAVAPDGRITVLDHTGIYAIDARRMTTQSLGSSPATQAGAGAWGGAAFNSRFYMGDPLGNRVVYVSPISTLTTFASGINGAEGLAFGPGGAWGTDLYVADANLTSLGTTADGLGRIVRVTSAGVVSTLVQNAGLLNGASGMAFDTYGRFGGNLFIADILGERVLQVTPAGAVSVFAAGFKNLSGSQCLAFGPDGALYVCDAGSGQPFSNSMGTNQPQIVRIAPAVLTTDVAGAVDAGRVSLAPPMPNPARDDVAFSFTLSVAGASKLSLYDLSGRLARTLWSGWADAGVRSVRWDVRDDRGRRVRAGMYFAVLETESGRAGRRVVVLP